MVVLVRGSLERWQMEAEAALVLRWIDGHPHALGRREGLLPREFHELAVGGEELVDVAHSS